MSEQPDIGSWSVMADIDVGFGEEDISSAQSSDSREERDPKRLRQEEPQEYTPLIPIVQRLLLQGEERDRKVDSLQSRNTLLEKENVMLKQQIRERDVQIEALQSHLRLVESEVIEIRKGCGHILSIDRPSYKERTPTTFHNITPKRSSSKTVIETNVELPSNSIIPDYSSIRSPRFCFGSHGCENGYLKFPSGVAVDENRNIIVSDGGNNRIQIFDYQGSFIRGFGRKGSKDGELHGPSAVILDMEGNIVVSDANNHRVITFDYNGNVLRKTGSFGEEFGMFNNPCGLGLDRRNGNILVADSFNHRIQVFDSNLNPLKTFGARGKKEGNLNRPTGLAVTSEGKVIVIDDRNHRFVVFDENGNYLYRFGRKGNRSREFCYPWGIALDQQENMLITDQQNNRIQVFDRQGRFLTSILCEMDSSPSGIVVNQVGDIIVADATHRIHIF